MGQANIGTLLRLRMEPESLTDKPTDENAQDAAATHKDAMYDRTLDSADPMLAAVPGRGVFEHQRVVDTARAALFGRSRRLRIGRYRVLRRLGSGGMGEVYLAHDDDLDREVAIKRVLSGESISLRSQERLRREARALARLSYPNVVQVYEVGEHEGRTFLAMEYVDGQHLGAWLAEEDRPWREILATFLLAGRGLVAAHAAQLVHVSSNTASLAR